MIENLFLEVLFGVILTVYVLAFILIVVFGVWEDSSWR